jgi:hypothetical protein
MGTPPLLLRCSSDRTSRPRRGGQIGKPSEGTPEEAGFLLAILAVTASPTPTVVVFPEIAAPIPIPAMVMFPAAGVPVPEPVVVAPGLVTGRHPV